jgi:hypothetical protein
MTAHKIKKFKIIKFSDNKFIYLLKKLTFLKVIFQIFQISDKKSKLNVHFAFFVPKKNK